MGFSSKNIRQDLADISGQGVRDINYGKLANKYMNDVKSREAIERSWENELELSTPHVQYVRNAIARAIKDDSMNNGMPLSSVFDALQIAKSHKYASKDTGIRQLVVYLNKKWESDRTGSINIGEFKDMERRFANQYPKSKVVEVLKDINKKGYATLPTNDLIHIASQIETQEDFERMVVKHSLQGNQPHNVKARNFLINIINKTHVEPKRGAFESENEDFYSKKFQDEVAEELYTRINEGMAEDEISEGYGYGSWALMVPEKVILNEDNQGFVSYKEFDTEEELMEAWNQIQSENPTGVDDELYEDDDESVESSSDRNKMSSKQQENYRERIIEDILNDHIVAYNDWHILVNNDDQVEVWPPSGEGFGTSLAYLDRAVNDFIKKAIVEPKVNVQQPDAVSVGDNPVGEDTTGKEIKLIHNEVNTSVKPDGPKSSPNLGEDSTMKVPKGMNPSINYRPGIPNTKMTDPKLGPDSSTKDPEFVDKGHKGAGKDPFKVQVNEQLKDKRTDSDQKSEPSEFHSKHVKHVEKEKEGKEKEGRIEDTFSQEPDATHIYRELLAKRPTADDLDGMFDGSWEAKQFFRHVAVGIEDPAACNDRKSDSDMIEGLDEGIDTPRSKEDVMSEINQIRSEIAELDEAHPLNAPLPEDVQARMNELREMKKVLMEEYRGVKHAAVYPAWLAARLLRDEVTRNTILEIFDNIGDEVDIADALEAEFGDDPFIVEDISGQWRSLAKAIDDILFDPNEDDKAEGLGFDPEKEGKTAGNKFREKWDTDGAYSREIEAESAGDLHNIIKSFSEVMDVEFDEAEPKKPEEYSDKEIKEDSMGILASTDIDSDKEAVDEEAKKYYKDYYGDFGEKLTEDKPGREKDKKKDKKGQAAPAPMTKEVPAQQSAPMTGPTTTPAPGVKTPAPGGDPTTGKTPIEPGMGNDGITALGWSEEDINLMPPDQKKKILENAINKPGTQKPTIPTPEGAVPQATTPTAPTPGAPTPAVPKGAQVMEQEPAAPQPAAPQPAGMDVSNGAPGGMGEPDAQVSIQEKLYNILAEVQGMSVDASSPEQIATIKASAFTKKIQTELGMAPDEAKRELGMNESKSLIELFK